MKVIIIGAGPAGLSAAYHLIKHGVQVLVIEKDSQVGGISKTINYKGFLFDLGGHRFFTKHQEVKKIWREVLPDDFLLRPRLSRIYYKNRLFYYPLKPLNALFNLGPFQAASALLSYIQARIKPDPDPANFEQWVSNRFGHRLYQIFFKTYTEKVWGIPCTEISADWAAQRIRDLSLGKAVANAFNLSGKNKPRTLIEEFYYPRRGPGQFWQKMADLIKDMGGEISLNTELVRYELEEGRIKCLKVKVNGLLSEIIADGVITTAPLSETIQSINSSIPDEVRKSAIALRYRDFITVGLIINREKLFPDNWIYIHSPEIRAGRLQNFKNWSPEMVPDSRFTSLGLEYFCFSSDEIWQAEDQQIKEIGIVDIVNLKMAAPGEVMDAFVKRVPKAYPVYERGYLKKVEIIKEFLRGLKNFQTAGRNGLHRYNNQDHSMLSGLMAARKILGEKGDPWEVNTEEEYHELARD